MSAVNDVEKKTDLLIHQAMSCLNDHLENHPDRDGNSVAYRIEQAIFLLRQAQSELCAAVPITSSVVPQETIS